MYRAPKSTLILRVGVALSLVGCTPDPGPGRSHAEVIDGAPDMTRPGVVALMQPFGDLWHAFCSGTVIGPYAVLTAKHCVADLSPGQVAIGQGVDVSAGVLRDVVPALEFRMPPGPVNLFDGSDVAVVLLARDLEAPAHDVGTAPPALSEIITIVGYGRIHPGVHRISDFGRKYSGTARVEYVGPGIFLTVGGSAGCHGDSGGAALDAAERVVGVTSFVTSTECDNAETGFAVASQHSAMIVDALTYVPPCVPAIERCNEFDDDCNGIVDDGCNQPGEPCALPAECESARCESVEGVLLCTADCDPTVRDACGPGLACEADACDTGRCVPAGTLAAGEPCTSHADCASARCAMLGDGSRCGEACVPEGAACNSELVCEAPDGVCGTCVPDALAPSPRLFGDPCDGDARCASGVCTNGLCSRACDAALPCPGGYHCRGSVCVLGDLGGAGDRCQTDEDCSSAAPTCSGEHDRFCAVPCNELGNCPVDFECVADACLPEGTALGEACAAPTECRSSRCEMGACTRACDPGDPCPSAFECTGTGATERLCVARPEEGGCSVVGAGGGTDLPILGALLLLILRRRVGQHMKSASAAPNRQRTDSGDARGAASSAHGRGAA